VDGDNALSFTESDSITFFTSGMPTQFTMKARCRYTDVTANGRILEGLAGTNWLFGWYGGNFPAHYANGWLSVNWPIGNGAMDTDFHEFTYSNNPSPEVNTCFVDGVGHVSGPVCQKTAGNPVAAGLRLRSTCGYKELEMA
jgi:hypothetical protein